MPPRRLLSLVHLTAASPLAACGQPDIVLPSSTGDTGSSTNDQSLSSTTGTDTNLDTSTGPADTSTGGAEAGMSDDSGTLLRSNYCASTAVLCCFEN